MISRFSFPTRIVFGPGALGELGTEARQLGIKRPLVVTDPGVVACGLAEQILDESRRAGLAASLFTGVDPNPVEKNVVAGTSRLSAGQLR